jgi:acyl-CoA synthetase (AMP-forming)/AMP-acid ligase II
MHLKSLFPELPPIPETNLHNLLFKRPDQASWPDYTAYIDAQTNQRVKFKEFLERIYDAATGLGSDVVAGGLGLQPGEVVGIMSENAIDYIALVHALLTLTVPFALLSSHSTPFELQHTLNLTKPSRLFVDAESLPRAVKVAQEHGISKDKIYVLTGKTPAGFLSFEDIVKKGRSLKRIGVKEAKKNTLAFLVLSSGTSGLPKAVMVTHGGLIASLFQAIVMGQAIALSNPPKPLKTPEGIPVILGFLPLHHSYGLHQFSFRAFMMPSTTVLQSKWDIDVAINAIQRHKISTLNLIPSIFHQLVNSPKFQNADLSTIAVITSGAAYLPQDLLKRMLTILPKDVMFAEGYGMSEATLGALMRPYPNLLPGKLMKFDPAATGILVPGMEVRVIRDDGQEADFDEPGELWFKADTISPGYWGNEKATKEAYTPDGWFKSGDMFRVSKEGLF